MESGVQGDTDHVPDDGTGADALALPEPASVGDRSPPSNLYFVRDEPDGEDYSLFVQARDTSRAIELWRSHFDRGGNPDFVYLLAEQIGQLEGALPWDALEITFQKGGIA